MSAEVLPPHDIEAERAVISAIALSADARAMVRDLIEPGHCYSESHRHIMRAVYDLEGRGAAIDLVSIRGALKASGRFDSIGGSTGLFDAIHATPAIGNVEQHAVTVRDKARLRDMIELCQRAAVEGARDCGDVQTFVDDVARRAFDVATTSASSMMVPLSTATSEAMATATAASMADRRGVTGAATGFDHLDRLTTGLHDGELFIVAGRPGMGKTRFVLNMAANMARDGEMGAAFFSLEMPREQLAMRLLACEARVDVSRIRSGELRPDDWTRLTAAAQVLSNTAIWLDDTPAITLMGVQSRVRRLQAEIQRGRSATKRLGLVAIDYLQLMQGSRNAGSREQEISELSRGLKKMAKELRVPVVALSQLNRSVETRHTKDKRPQLSDLRESGAIEQDADTILFVYRDEYYFKDESVDKGIAEIIIAKQRNGPTDTVKTRFTSAYTRFDNLESCEPPPEYAQSYAADDFDDMGRDMRGGY